MQRSALCRSRRELSNAYFLAKLGFDTAENEPCQVCPIPRNAALKAPQPPARGAARARQGALRLQRLVPREAVRVAQDAGRRHRRRVQAAKCRAAIIVAVLFADLFPGIFAVLQCFSINFDDYIRDIVFYFSQRGNAPSACRSSTKY